MCEAIAKWTILGHGNIVRVKHKKIAHNFDSSGAVSRRPRIGGLYLDKRAKKYDSLPILAI